MFEGNVGNMKEGNNKEFLEDRREDSPESRIFRKAVDMYMDGRDNPELLEEMRSLAKDPRLSEEIKNFLESSGKDSEIEYNIAFEKKAKELVCAEHIAGEISKLIKAHMVRRMLREAALELAKDDQEVLKKIKKILSSPGFEDKLKNSLKEIFQSGEVVNVQKSLGDRAKLLKRVLRMLLEGELSD